jgi:hypothetical protein
MTEPRTIMIDGTKYIREQDAQATPVVEGSRRVVVVDRGWIFAGDVERNDEDSGYVLSRALHVFSWQSIGFDGVLKTPKSDKVQLKKLSHNVEVPDGSVVFSVPVADDWGL